MQQLPPSEWIRRSPVTFNLQAGESLHQCQHCSAHVIFDRLGSPGVVVKRASGLEKTDAAMIRLFEFDCPRCKRRFSIPAE